MSREASIQRLLTTSQQVVRVSRKIRTLGFACVRNFLVVVVLMMMIKKKRTIGDVYLSIPVSIWFICFLFARKERVWADRSVVAFLVVRRSRKEIPLIHVGRKVCVLIEASVQVERNKKTKRKEKRIYCKRHAWFGTKVVAACSPKRTSYASGREIDLTVKWHTVTVKKKRYIIVGTYVNS